MKRLIKAVLNQLGFAIIEKNYYKNLIHINSLSSIDCHFVIKQILDKEGPHTIFDVGANIGQTTQKLHGYFSNAFIYSFEPIEDTFKSLERNVSHNQKVKIYRCAMGSSKGEKVVFLQQNSEWNSLATVSGDIAKHNTTPSEIVSIETLDDFCRENKIGNIDFLKSDTEGYEIEVLKGAHNTLFTESIKILYIEVGFSNNDPQHTYWTDVIRLMENYNYTFSGFFEMAYLDGFKLDYANALFINSELLKKKHLNR